METWSHTAPGGDLPPGHVHLWFADLDAAAGRWEALLSAEELERAGRFHYVTDRRRYAAARGILRTLLGRYLASDAAALAIGREAHGKPCLLGEHAASGLRFNLSHTGGWGLFGFATGMRIGVDVEHGLRTVGFMAIAERHFSPGEVEALRRAPATGLARAFFVCWTRKEAYIKALGSGLAHPLARFEVSVEPSAPALRRDEADPAAADLWTMIHLEPRPDVVGAAAVEGRGVSVSRLLWRSAGGG